MSQYAEKDFNSNVYESNRPKYPTSLFNAIFQYHEGPRKLGVDVGCGPGTSSFPMLQYVDKIKATDPSSVMIQPGKGAITEGIQDRISFHVAKGEDLSEIIPEDGTVDLLYVSEALHWINHEAFFKEAARVLRKNGTLAYWGYIEPRFIDFPRANEIYEKYVYEDPRFMGPYWAPGKSYLRYFYDDIKLPKEYFHDVEKHDYIPLETAEHTAYYQGDHQYSLKKFRAYLESWSAVHSWRKAHPHDKDLIDQFIDELQSELGWSDDTALRAEWGTTYVFARRV